MKCRFCLNETDNEICEDCTHKTECNHNLFSYVYESVMKCEKCGELVKTEY